MLLMITELYAELTHFRIACISFLVIVCTIQIDGRPLKFQNESIHETENRLQEKRKVANALMKHNGNVSSGYRNATSNRATMPIHRVARLLKLNSTQIDGIKVQELAPPDHLDAVKMEQDGHINRDYIKEIFLGNHEEADNFSDSQLIELLTGIFHKIDTNKDGNIQITEMKNWITIKIKEHFQEAIDENEMVFGALDADKDGYVVWKEFHLMFLIANGYPQALAKKQVFDYDSINMEAEVKDDLIRYKFKWADADDSPKDDKLDLAEFKSFRHPEQSNGTMMRMVTDILENLDENHDEKLTEAEFVALSPGEDVLDKAAGDYFSERQNEFRNVIDLNHDGIVSKEELLIYVNPVNEKHLEDEAYNLILLGDANDDLLLSLSEILAQKQLYVGSKLVNPAINLHLEL